MKELPAKVLQGVLHGRSDDLAYAAKLLADERDLKAHVRHVLSYGSSREQHLDTVLSLLPPRESEKLYSIIHPQVGEAFAEALRDLGARLEWLVGPLPTLNSMLQDELFQKRSLADRPKEVLNRQIALVDALLMDSADLTNHAWTMALSRSDERRAVFRAVLSNSSVHNADKIRLRLTKKYCVMEHYCGAKRRTPARVDRKFWYSTKSVLREWLGPARCATAHRRWVWLPINALPWTFQHQLKQRGAEVIGISFRDRLVKLWMPQTQQPEVYGPEHFGQHDVV